MLERDLVKKIIDYIKTTKCAFAWKEHGGMYGTGGVPDIICCYRGRFIALECKVEGNKPTKLQEDTIKRIRDAGGKAVVVYSLDEAKAAMEEMEKETNAED